MKYATTQSDRVALIKEIADRKRKMELIKKKSAAAARTMRTAAKPSKPARTFLDAQDDTSKNVNYYTDASKYAQQYYGETFYETTRHDADWGDY